MLQNLKYLQQAVKSNTQNYRHEEREGIKLLHGHCHLKLDYLALERKKYIWSESFFKKKTTLSVTSLS